jgi:hypothetical protein
MVFSVMMAPHLLLYDFSVREVGETVKQPGTNWRAKKGNCSLIISRLFYKTAFLDKSNKSSKK